jgi:hypothetical protein
MTCRDFQRKWDELLDADARAAAIGAESLSMPDGPTSSPSGEPGEAAQVDHAAGCPECRQLAARYRVLRQATRAWKSPPVAPADLADRILAAARTAPSSARLISSGESRKRRWSRVLPLASMVAASIMIAVVLNRNDGRPANPPTITSLPSDRDLQAVSSRSTRAPGDRPALNRALAEATTATFDLARSASEPAARISRDMLKATAQPGEVGSDPQSEARPEGGDRTGMVIVDLAVQVPSLAPFAPDPSAASSALQQVGDHVAAGVRPLSDTARHAFGFLIGTAPDQAGPRTSPPSAGGA